MFLNRVNKGLSDEILKAFQVSSDPTVQLSRAARVLARGLDADLCSICVRDKDRQSVLIRGASDGAALSTDVPAPAAEASLLEALASGRPVHWKRGEGAPVPISGPLAGKVSCVLLYPVNWRDRPVALVTIGFGSRRKVPARVLGALAGVSGTLAAVVRGSVARHYQTRKNELAGDLLQISEHLGTASDVQGCLAMIARNAAELTGSAGAVLRILDNGGFTVRAFFGRELSALSPITTSNDLPSTLKALETGRSVTVNRACFNPAAADRPVSRNMLCVPFGAGTGPKGVLTVFDRGDRDGSRSYGRIERETLKALTRIGSTAVNQIRKEEEIRDISRSLEGRVRELTLLRQISRAVHEREEVQEVLRSLLESVTDVRGLGFDRAFLFLLDPEKNILRGLVGIEAQPDEGERGPDEEPGHRELDGLISGFRIPVTTEGGVIPRTVLEKNSFRISLPRDRALISEEVVAGMGGVDSFATVPLLSEGRVLGVIWVDNLHTRRSIGTEDFQLLMSAAAQAGLAVERSLRAEALAALNGQLMDLQNRMIQWEKMAALGEMAASVAHDIRNPLVSIGGFTRRLRKLIPEDGKGRQYADIILREVDRLEWTLDNVMSYARSYGVTDRRPVPLSPLLSECAELFRENFRKRKVTLRRHISRDLPEVPVDERQIKQAVLNVLFNAGEAAGEGSEVSFSARMSEEGPRCGVIISVSDRGKGIDPGDMENIFRPFFTTKGTGTGLGLAIANRAISGHGGEIRVDNRYGEGVTFTIYLPASLGT